MRPAAIHICNGSFGEAEYLSAALEQMGVLEKLSGYDEVFVARTDPRDCVERPVYICSTRLEDIQEARKQQNPSWTTARWISPAQFSFQWLCNPDRFFLALRPLDNEIWSFGSAFGENAFLSKKSLGLRLASYRGWKEGWLAINAALIAVKNPAGKEVFGCVSFPYGVGKTQIATMTPSIQGWQVRVFGDDIAWIRCGENRVMYAFAPEYGMFGCPTGATHANAPNVFEMLKREAILMNCGTTSKGRFFWEALKETLEPEEKVSDWKKEEWKSDEKRPPNHLNCRYSVFMSSAPNLHPDWELSAGVPISFLVFGCKRPDEMPLIYETESWEHGVVMAAGLRTVSLSAIDQPSSCHLFQMPRIFMVNWYQEGPDGKPIWPGFRENIRVLEWILNRYTHKNSKMELVPESTSPRCIAPNETPTTNAAIGVLPKKLNTEVS
ncbi:unnamed protein product [Haemonchus placei]|uniref:phosphoenolpyruvate carboxykinase (GTP) n=1 Tax=Haemonchus placei TaxID=6290 RepID=A0A0N4WD26_HAEPC|nr:unnamed protein product [Haemonchus placei]